jgi:hypothetical protein
VAAAAVDPDPRTLVRRSWAAVGAGEASVAAAGFFALWAVASEIDCIGFGCSDDSGLGAEAVFLLASAVVLLVVGLGWTAYVSRGTLRDAVVRGALAASSMAAAVLFVWLPFGEGGFAPGLVLAVGVAAAIVLREPTRLARSLRIAAIVVLVLTTIVDDSLALVLVALLVFPAIGIADTFAIPREPEPER